MDDGLILISDFCNHHKIRHHSAYPIIPTFQYSTALKHGKAYYLWPPNNGRFIRWIQINDK